ncbi:MAG: HEAT repeat domain-containing protein [Polyangiaceae bacterium]|nr:HEAT repeat domain-containing protein [Polyangiaceae bacterium]
MRSFRLTCRAVPFVIVAALSIGACGKKQPQQAKPATSASAAPVDELKAFLDDDKAALTEGVYRKLLLALEKCKVDERGIDPKCEASKNLRKARNRKTPVKEKQAMDGKLGKELISHAHPAVRLQAAKLLQSAYGASKETQDIIIKAAKAEKEPSVLAAMIRTIGSRHKDQPDIKELLLAMSDHSSDVVRRESMSWFLTNFGEGVEGTFEKVLEKMENDPSEDVRAYLCGRLYGSADERALPVFEKYLLADNTPTKLYNACWNGVINSWTGFPKPKKPSQKGYELTMKVLEKKPRTKDRPPWSGISTLRSAKGEYRENDKFGAEWLEAVKGWYKTDRLLKALHAIAIDGDANWMARTAALRVMQELGEKKAAFVTLQKKYADAKAGDDFHVKRQLDDILRKLDSDKGRPAGSGSAGPAGGPRPRGKRMGPPPGPGAPPPPAPPAGDGE